MPYVTQRASIIWAMRAMLLFEEQMNEKRHSSGSCRSTRSPGNPVCINVVQVTNPVRINVVHPTYSRFTYNEADV